jgi:Domain of unknown function (DUF3859)
MPMRFWFILACGMTMATPLVLPLPVNAQSAKSVEITEYGIYTTDRTNSHRDANGILQSDATNVRHAATTSTVSAEIGTHFGFRYHISGEPAGAPITLRKVVIYPDGGLKPPNSPTPLRKVERELARKLGATSYADYAFDDPWELVPGTWTFQLWEGDRKLAEKSFIVEAR